MKLSVALLLFCTASSNLRGVAEGIVGSLVELEAKTQHLVEGQMADFECRYYGKITAANLSWHLQNSHFRDPVKGDFIPMFETPTGGPHPVSKGPLRFRLSMRRDFEGNWLVCNSSDGGRAQLTFGRVEQTIPFDVIQPNHTFLVTPKITKGRSMRLCCNVSRAIENIRMDMLLYRHYERINLYLEYAKGTHFCALEWAPSHTFWGLYSCVARSNIGTVYSHVKRLLFFNPIFKIPQSPISLFFDEKVTVSVHYADKQLPPSWLNVFKIFEIDDKNRTTREVKVLNVSVSKLPGTFNITFVWYINLLANITFVAKRPGRFQVFFQILEHYMPYLFNRSGPVLRVLDNYAEISEEHLVESHVTLGAFASLSFRFNVSECPEEHLSVEGPVGSELSRNDFLFDFDRATSKARLDFVVHAAGDYQVIFRFPKVVTVGKKHEIRTSRPMLSLPVTLIDRVLTDEVVVPVVYLGRQPPAFPLRVFKVSKVAPGGRLFQANLPVLSVRMVPSGEAQFTAKVTFAPSGAGFYEISLHVGLERLRGPRIDVRKIEEEKSSNAAACITGFVVIFGLICFLWGIYLYFWRKGNPKPLRISVVSPEGYTEDKTAEVRGRQYEEIITSAERNFDWLPTVGNSPLLFWREGIYTRGNGKAQRRFLHGFDASKNKTFSVDAEDGVKVEDLLFRVGRHFLLPSCRLPAPPRLMPNVVMVTDMELYCVTQSRDLYIAPHGAVSDPSFVACLWGVRSGERLFWEGSYYFSEFVDAESGEEFSIQDIPGEGPKCFIIALMRAGDPVPRCNVPRLQSYLLVFRRPGLELKIEDIYVRSAGPSNPSDIGQWVRPWLFDDFDRNFREAAMRYQERAVDPTSLRRRPPNPINC